MTHSARLILIASLLFPAAIVRAADAPYSGAACTAAADDFFTREVWVKVAAQTCLECHKTGGDAEDSDFVLLDLAKLQGHARDQAMAKNRAAFAAMARLKENNQSRLLLKPTAQIKHGGKQQLKPGSAPYKVLAEFVRRVNDPNGASLAQITDDKNARPFFDGVVMLDDQRLLRRVTLTLAGRLPTDAEQTRLAQEGHSALSAILDDLLKEEGFYTRLREAFNDIFLTVGYDDVPENALSYEHFSTTRGWAEKADLSHIADPKERQQAKYKLSGDYRKAMLGEPMKLIEHIVRNDRPFSEIITADYIMVTPYTSRGYGIYDQIKDRFKNPEDPFEYIPVKLKALVARTKDDNQESATGYYPHAGILSTFQWMKRYTTTETNRNRARTRIFYLQFLGVDLLELAARVTDAAAIQAKYEIPTMQASECVVCHKTLDPVAGLFQNYWKFEGVYGPRKGGWFKDMFPPGFEGEDLPADQRWRSLQWLGERTIKDPRFSIAMVEHGYYLLTGRKALRPPKDVEDPLFNARRRAYTEQRRLFESIATRFAANNFNFKSVLKELIESQWYRADGLATVAATPDRQAELDDVGLVRMLAPEQLERKITAIFGTPWGKLTDQMAALYGGIDSKEVTERATDPSGAMGAIQRILANDVACKQTATDFSKPTADRKLFPLIEPDLVPDTPENDAKIRQQIQYLHNRLLGRSDPPNSPAVDRTFRLFADIVTDAAGRKVSPDETYPCRAAKEKPLKDPKYTLRAWRAVLTYLMRRQEFLYE